jgi:integrase
VIQIPVRITIRITIWSYVSFMSARAKKGTVQIQSIKGRLRLYWSTGGDRYYLSLQLPDSKLNRSAAQMLATRIEEDIRTNNFDPTLAKYKPTESTSISVADLFNRFHKSKPHLEKATHEKYNALHNQLTQWFGDTDADTIDSAAASQFIEALSTQYKQKPPTVRDRVSLLRACWDWGIHQKLINENPWRQVELKKAPRPKPNPFSEDEVRRILMYFRSEPRVQYYADLVEFRLKIGCRTGEAVGLCWRHLNSDCSSILIAESVSKNKRKATKTGEERGFELSADVQKLLLNRRPKNVKPNDLVFPGPKGAVIDAKNFAARIWKPVLAELGIEYRRPYKTRSTFASHALEHGATPSEVCDITGHSQETLFKNYAGSIKRSRLPDLW